MEDMMNALIRNRKLIVPGKGDVPDISNGTKVTFHFKTVAIYTENENSCKHNHLQNSCSSSKHFQSSPDDNNSKDNISENNIFTKEITIDDSKAENCKPMELFYGHQFKFPLWEEWLKNMRINERSQLTLDWRLCEKIYPLLSKSYRNFCSPPSRIYETDVTRARRANHCCGMQNSTQKASLGFKDLDCLVEHPPSKLQFTLELLSIETPKRTDKEVWLMNDEDMITTLPELRIEAGKMFAKKEYKEAADKYRKALAILEQLQIKEKPNDCEWNELEMKKVPFLSNLSQCELFLGQFYEALEHSDDAFKKDTNNVKALFRRAKANLAVWNFDEARADFLSVKILDSSLNEVIKNQMIVLEKKEKDKKLQDEHKFKGKLFG